VSAGNSPSDWFSPGQKDDMFKEVAAFLAKRSVVIELYDP
jgi:hypothetical protein